MHFRQFVAAALVVAASAAVSGQTYLGSLRGTIRDRDGVIGGAIVQLIEDDTGFTRRVVSERTGDFVFASMPPGVYSLRASHPGFKGYERGRLVLGTQSALAVEIVLETGPFSELIMVAAESPLLDTASASVSTLLDLAALEQLPTPGRNVFFMATTTRTVVASGDSQFVRQQDQSNSSLISLGGGPRRTNGYLLDGVPIVDIQNRATFIPSLHAIGEMRVQLSAYDAQIGRTSGGVFNAVARAGSNAWHGRGLYQDRPSWGTAQLFFAKKADLPSTPSYYHLYGGGAGGPIIKNRTFFWASTEGYRSRTRRNTVLRLPTAPERLGDFSQSGVTLYDPLTTRPDPLDSSRFIRDPFPGNRIPAGRMNPVAMELLKYIPSPITGSSRPAEASIVDAADQITGKVTHRWSDSVVSHALYAWYQSHEPDARFFGGQLFENGADPGDGALVRGLNLLTVTTMWTPGSRSVVELRYGSHRFVDHNKPAPFDASSLGFSASFLRSMAFSKFPGIGVADYGRGGALLGDRSHERSSYYGDHGSATVSVSLGRHSLKSGTELRTTGVSFFNQGGPGNYDFSRDFTMGPDPNTPAAASGESFASFLLGYPASGFISTSSPIDVYLKYWSAYVQDDIRVSDRLTLTAGLRYEREQGLQERANRMTVGWASDQPFPVQPGGLRPDGTPLVLTGGFLYAGEGGASTHQGAPNSLQFSPRLGAAFLVTSTTVFHAGYGIFWAPPLGINASEAGSGTRGYNQTTSYIPSLGSPLIPCGTCTLTDPFPAGVTQPEGSAMGRLTGVGSTVQFVDSNTRMAHFHRYSMDLQHEYRGMRVEVGYLGTAGRDLAGSVSGGLQVNQLDPKYMALGSALQEPVPNPFVGTALAVGILSGPTVSRAQLLRPYPQFDGIEKQRPILSRSRYDALILAAERRLSRGWGARASYTLSRLQDSQYGESNFFSGGSSILNAYDVDREYGLSVLDTTHQLRLTGVAELPLGVMVSVSAGYQSGFPISVFQGNNNTGLMSQSQRPNIVNGVDPRLTDNPEQVYDAGCGCIRWLNPAAWSQAAPFTFGDAPRTDGRIRTPTRGNWDVAVEKTLRVGASRLSLRAEIINLLNHADLRGPNMVYGSATFGQIREVAGFPRMLQMSARVAW